MKDLDPELKIMTDMISDALKLAYLAISPGDTQRNSLICDIVLMSMATFFTPCPLDEEMRRTLSDRFYKMLSVQNEETLQ